MTEEVLILGHLHHIDIYRNSQEFKLEVLARMIAGYGEGTWNALSTSRKRTYRRAADSVFHQWDDFKEQMERWQAGL